MYADIVGTIGIPIYTQGTGLTLVVGTRRQCYFECVPYVLVGFNGICSARFLLILFLRNLEVWDGLAFNI